MKRLGGSPMRRREFIAAAWPLAPDLLVGDKLLGRLHPDLANGIDLAGRWDDELDAPIRDFIRRSARYARLAHTLTATAAVLFAMTAALSAWLYIEANRANRTDQNERDNALIAQSHFLAKISQSQNAEGDPVTAMLVSLEGLRDDGSATQTQRDRPYVSDADQTLNEAFWSQRETRVLVGSFSEAFFNGNGSRLLSVSGNTAQLLDSVSGRKLVTFTGSSQVKRARFSPDETQVLTVSDDVRLWESETGRSLAVFEIPNIPEAAPIPDPHFPVTRVSSILAAGFVGTRSQALVRFADDSVALWDVQNNAKVATFESAEQSRTLRAEFSLDGTRIITASLRSVAIWDAGTGKKLSESAALYPRIGTFSSDGTRFITESSGTVQVWDMTGREITRIKDSASHMVLNQDGSLMATASRDQTARVYDAHSGQLISTLRGHQSELRSVSFSVDGAWVLTSSGSVYGGGEDQTARVWDARTGDELLTLSGHGGVVWSAAFSPDRRRVVTVSGDDQRTLRLWDVTLDRDAVRLLGHQASILSAAFSADAEKVVTTSVDSTARLWETSSGHMIFALAGHTGPVSKAAFSPDGKLVATASWDTTTRIWDASSGKLLFVVSADDSHTNNTTDDATNIDARIPSSVSWSADSMHLLVSNGTLARIFDVVSRHPVTLLGHEDKVMDAAFTQDGQRVITASTDKMIRVWDTTAGHEIAVLNGHDGPVLSVKFALDGSRFISTSADKTARIWDTSNWRQKLVFRGHDAAVWRGLFSSDGSLAATVSVDNVLKIWDVNTGTEIAAPRSYSGELLNVLLGNNMIRVVTAIGEDAAEIMRVFPSTSDLIRETKSVAPRCLTPAQRKQFFLELAPPDWCVSGEKWPYGAQEWKSWLAQKKAGQSPQLPNSGRNESP
jgi:WD40 repeat protein